MGVKIRYSITQRLRYYGTAEVSEDMYEAMKDADSSDSETILADLILDCIDKNDPQDWDIDSVDEFEKVS